MPSKKDNNGILLSPKFKLVFLTASVFTLLSFIGTFVCAVWDKDHPMLGTLFSTLETTWKIGFGAIIGLIGGKVAE
jgi:hypothetical protein